MVRWKALVAAFGGLVLGFIEAAFCKKNLFATVFEIPKISARLHRSEVKNLATFDNLFGKTLKFEQHLQHSNNDCHMLAKFWPTC